mmetsp:Transcript_1790/g.4482  ORF Transcript_1790/g.4482 Transcript_1790/m.4482 type:complete len:235 (-) Transcript_1790:56-760(-)
MLNAAVAALDCASLLVKEKALPEAGATGTDCASFFVIIEEALPEAGILISAELFDFPSSTKRFGGAPRPVEYHQRLSSAREHKPFPSVSISSSSCQTLQPLRGAAREARKHRAGAQHFLQLACGAASLVRRFQGLDHLRDQQIHLNRVVSSHWPDHPQVLQERHELVQRDLAGVVRVVARKYLCECRAEFIRSYPIGRGATTLPQTRTAVPRGVPILPPTRQLVELDGTRAVAV